MTIQSLSLLLHYPFVALLVWPDHRDILQGWSIRKNLHPGWGVDKYVFSHEEAYLVATGQGGTCQETVESYAACIVEFSNKGSNCGSVAERSNAGE